VVLEGRDESEVVNLKISANTTVKSTTAATRIGRSRSYDASLRRSVCCCNVYCNVVDEVR
jgi:hypothetical protein